MRQELKNVIERAQACLEDSKYLLEGKRYEAAVNRAYYSMFTAVVGILLDKDIYVKTHSGARTKFHELFLKSNLLPSELGKIFDDASDIRQEADYDFAINIEPEEALKTITDAEYFLNRIVKFLQQNK